MQRRTGTSTGSSELARHEALTLIAALALTVAAGVERRQSKIVSEASELEHSRPNRRGAKGHFLRCTRPPFLHW